MADDELEDSARPRPGRFSTLPPRIPLEDTVEETDARSPKDLPSSDPNRDVANRWGAGLVGF